MRRRSSWSWATRSGSWSTPSPATGSPTPLRFRQSVGTEMAFRGRLEPIVFSSLRSVLGEAPLFTILSQDRTQLMNRIKSEANKSLAGFGVELVDVRIKRADLPPENSQAVFRRMQTEREREAKELRAQGAEVGQRIRARADRERRVLIAEAAAGSGRSPAARATPRRSGSSPKRSARTPSSSTSTGRCRPIATRWVTAPPASSCRPTASSSASSTAGAVRAAGAAAGRRRTRRRPRAAAPPRRGARPDAAAIAARVCPMVDLGTGLALVLVVEGVLWALFPERDEAGRGAGGHDGSRRAALGGLAFAVVGVLLVWAASAARCHRRPWHWTLASVMASTMIAADWVGDRPRCRAGVTRQFDARVDRRGRHGRPDRMGDR